MIDLRFVIDGRVIEISSKLRLSRVCQALHDLTTKPPSNVEYSKQTSLGDASFSKSIVLSLPYLNMSQVFPKPT